MILNRFFIEKSPQYEGQVVTLKGWVFQRRSSGKIKFLVIRDGTGFLQGILLKEECSPEAFLDFDRLTQESSLEVTGLLKKEPRALGGYEITLHTLKPIHIASPYPISPKEHGVEFLMENRHLWIRSSRQWAALRIRSKILKAIHHFFDSQGFIRFDAPILTPSACEGTSTLFSTAYFEEQAYLTQSGQLYGEVGAMAFGKIYVSGPTFRAEKSKTRKHLTEFWMIEPEMAFADLEDAMQLGETLIAFIIQAVLEQCSTELQILERNLESLKSIRTPFPRITYDEALDLLKQQGIDLAWGEDFGAPHEAALGKVMGQPVFIHHMPASIKAFYFKRDKNYALGCDLIAPDGYGEIIGGGQREEDETLLKQQMMEHHLAEKDYSWYLDLRRFGSVPHSGFGLGLERVVAWMTGVEHVRETIPFPRLMNTLRP